MLTELPKDMAIAQQEHLFNNIIKNMIGFLIVLPDNPQNDYLYIYSGFYQAIKQINW